MFRNPPAEGEGAQDRARAGQYGRAYDSIEIERLRRSQASGVTRVESRDEEDGLPSYRECLRLFASCRQRVLRRLRGSQDKWTRLRAAGGWWPGLLVGWIDR